MKEPNDYYEHRKKRLRHVLLKRLPEEILESREDDNYIAEDREAISKAKVEEYFLELIRTFDDVSDLEFKLPPIKTLPVKKDSRMYDRLLHLETLHGAIIEMIGAIKKGDDDFFLKLSRAIRFKSTENNNWRQIYRMMGTLKKELGRYPTCTELWERVSTPPLRLPIDKRTVLFLCKEHGIPLIMGKSGRPKKSG